MQQKNTSIQDSGYQKQIMELSTQMSGQYDYTCRAINQQIVFQITDKHLEQKQDQQYKTRKEVKIILSNQIKDRFTDISQTLNYYKKGRIQVINSEKKELTLHIDNQRTKLSFSQIQKELNEAIPQKAIKKTPAQIEAQKFIQDLYNKALKHKGKKQIKQQQSVKLEQDQNHSFKKRHTSKDTIKQLSKDKKQAHKNKEKLQSKTDKSINKHQRNHKSRQTYNKKKSKVKQQQQQVKQQPQPELPYNQSTNNETKIQEQTQTKLNAKNKLRRHHKNKSKSKNKSTQFEKQIIKDIQKGVKLAQDQIINKIQEQVDTNSNKEEQYTIQKTQAKKNIAKKKREKYKAEDEQKVQQILRLRDERDARQEAEWLVKQQRQILLRFGTKIQLQFDPSCRHYDQYKIKKDEIQKKGKLYCQIYNKNAVPADSKHYFQFKIVRLTFQSITVGVITSDNFDCQYSRDKSNCLCFDAYTHSVYVQGVQTELDAQISVGDIIRTGVDIPNKTIQWYINNELISQTQIPDHIASKQIFPCIEISNKWIKIRINKVD